MTSKYPLDAEAVRDLLDAAKMLVSYRDRAGAINFQLEKADTYIDLLRAAIAKAEPLAPMTRNTGKGEGQEVTP